MDKLFSRILFIILVPIFVPLSLFSHLTYPWWLELYKGKFGKKVLFFILAPIYGPIALFLNISYEWWAGLF